MPEDIEIALKQLIRKSKTPDEISIDHPFFKFSRAYSIFWCDCKFDKKSRFLSFDHSDGVRGDDMVLSFADFISPFVYGEIGTPIGTMNCEAWTNYPHSPRTLFKTR